MANQVKARLISNKKVGSYHHLILAGEGIAQGVRPGHFAAVAVGDANTPMVLRRAFSIHKANEVTSRGSTLELVVAPHGPGTEWLVAQNEGAIIDVVAPLGKPFALPKVAANCLLVAGGYGSAPMVYLAQELIARGCM